METYNETDTDYPPSPNNEESEDDSGLKGFSDQGEEEHEELGKENKVASLLKQLQSSGALVRKPKEEFHCKTCNEQYTKWDEFENHLLQHVSLPIILLDKLSDAESDTAQSGDENWSDEEEAQSPPKPGAKTPQKIDISQFLGKTGLSIKRPGSSAPATADSALNKLSGLGFTIKKNVTPIKQEKSEPDTNNSDLMQKLGKLGGIKLKLKSEGNNSNSFKVVNGLKDFKTSDDEESANEDEHKSGDEYDSDEDKDNKPQHEKEFDQESEEEHSPPKIQAKKSGSVENPKTAETADKKKAPVKAPVKPKANVQSKPTPPKVEPLRISKVANAKVPATATTPTKPGRPAVKQTPRRGSIVKEIPENEVKTEPPTQSNQITTSSLQQKIALASEPPQPSPTPPQQPTPQKQQQPQKTAQRSQSSETNTVQNVTIKQEVDNDTPGTNQDLPMFSDHIKTERTSPPPADVISTPMIAIVKSETDAAFGDNSSQVYSHQTPVTTAPATQPLMTVTKQENTGVTVIEINGDSNDEDDDCCVVSATPAPDVKPIVPKTENPTYHPSTSYSTSQASHSAAQSMLSSRLMSSTSMPSTSMLSTEKQHNFNWNAPDTKPILDISEKSAEDIFDSLFSSTKKENLSDASEYISLDRLGPQHSCDICNTRFTDISLLDDHIRTTGHSKTIIAPTASTLLPYNATSSSLISSLFPVKQLAEQVGKLSTIGGPGAGAFTHQQNVMINIQAYPGATGMMSQPYSQAQMSSGYQGSSPMYPGATPGQPMPGQPMSGQAYGNSPYMGQQGYAQYPSPMSKAYQQGAGGIPTSSYPGHAGPNTSPYSTASPLQSMQQAVYGQTSPGMMTSPGQLGQIPTSQPSIKIQNIQTFAPGQLSTPLGGQGVPGQMGPPGQMGVQGQMGPPGSMTSPGGQQIRISNPVGGPGRPRMPGVRAGAGPSIRPGIQVHGQAVRGGKAGGPRMPLKRPAGAAGGAPGQKRRPDMLLPGKHDNEDCQVMAMQKQREGMPMIQSVQGAKDKLGLGSQISITKKPAMNKEANAMANVLASRGIMVKQKQKSRSPSPERPVPHIPNLGAGVSIKHTSKSSNFNIPEAKVGGGMYSCKICRKMFMNHNSLSVHMNAAHPQSKVHMFKCDECPASYPKSLQLQHHKRVFHNVTGPNRELGLPVVDLSQEDNLKRLSSLGIYSFIPLANREQAGGCFGIPVISVHNANNGMTNSLQALGADGLLSLGPLKPLPNS